MLEIKCFSFGLMQTNTYLVSNASGEALLIDPACQSVYEQQALLRHVETQQLQIRAIIATHGHLDHVWGASFACEQWGMPLLVPKGDVPLVERLQEQYDLFGIGTTAPRFPYSAFGIQSSAITLHLSPFNFQLIPTPGHTPGGVCLYSKEEKVLLSGDTLFRYGYGRTDLPGGNATQLFESLDRLFQLSADTRVYPGHGDFTTIGAERR